MTMATSEIGTTKRKLPPDWRWVRLGDVCKVVSGSTPLSGIEDYWGGDVVWITPTDLGKLNEPYIMNSARRITKAGYDSCGTELVPPGTVVLSSRAPIGHLGIATIPLCTNQGCKSFIPGEGVDSVYLYFALEQSVSELQALGSGATFAEVSKSQVEGFEIPLPPLSEQKRIAAILTEQMATVERARAAADAQMEAAKALSAAYLRAVFNSPEAQKWLRKRLGEVGKIVSGVTLGRKIHDTKTISVPYLRVANVKDGRLELSDVYRIEATEDEIEICRLKFGDLLLTEGGDPDKLGRGMYWEEQIPVCIHQNHIFRVRFDLNMFCPKFISAQFGSPYGKAYFLTHAKQTTGIATINQKVLAGFPLMVPSLSEQKRISTILDEKMAATEHYCKVLEDQLTAINKLPSALLRQAFNGGL